MTMKTVSIGDIHGSALWKMIKPDEYDRIIFVGDYVDSFTHSDVEILHNLKDIIAFKEKYPDKVVLLWGNHDNQYLFSHQAYGCSGYRQSMYHQLHDLFNKNIDLFIPSYRIQSDDQEYIWTHAGIHEGWYNQHFLPRMEEMGLADKPIDEQINAAFKEQMYALLQVGHLRGGYEDMGGIFWVDRRLVSDKPKKHIRQIVGHSKVDEIYTVDVDYYTSITFIDCLEGKNPLFYELNLL